MNSETKTLTDLGYRINSARLEIALRECKQYSSPISEVQLAIFTIISSYSVMAYNAGREGAPIETVFPFLERIESEVTA